MTKKQIAKYCAEYSESILLADGFEDAFIGVGVQFTHEPIALYDRAKCIDILMKRDGMDDESANEYFEFNTQGAWVGDQTPVFITLANEPKARR